MAYKRRLRFDKRIYFKKNMSIIYILLFVVLASLSVGYAYIKSNLNINGTANVTAASWDVHFNNLNVTTGSVTATTAASITDPTTVTFVATLDEPNDFYEFTVDVTNQGTMDAMIDSFSISPTLTTAQAKYLEYTVSYSDGTPLANKQELKANTSENLKVRFSYIENSDKTNYPTENQTFNIEFSMDYIQADGSETSVIHSISFEDDDWETIIAIVQSGDTSNYNVGDTKEVDLGTLGTHTLRIANKSTPSECSTTGFSQTACGFVLEFTDLVDQIKMKYSNSNTGGWPSTLIRTYLSDDFYNLLPSDLQSGIINTTVVSGCGVNESNSYTSTDKIYLLDTKEIYGNSFTSQYNSANNAERQLDYYYGQGVTTSNYSAAVKQYNGTNTIWWLRSANSSITGYFYHVNTVGYWSSYQANMSYGVSPAFRIG